MRKVCFPSTTGHEIIFMATRSPSFCSDQRVFKKKVVKNREGRLEVSLQKKASGKPGLPRVLQVKETQRYFWIVTNHAGQSLQNVPRRKISRDGLVRDIKPALQTLARLGYRHLDLYPRNVLFDSTTGRYTLIDFGKMARVSGSRFVDKDMKTLLKNTFHT